MNGFTTPEPQFDHGAHTRGKIGYVLLATEQTVQDDVLRLTPPAIGVHFTRAAIPDSITVATLSDLGNDLARAASTMLPDGSLDVISYACTSGSLVLGEDKVFAELSKGAPNAITTSLITGVIRALKAVGAKRLAVATPYLDEINTLEKAYLEANGFEVVRIKGMQLEKDSDMVRVRPAYIAKFASALDGPDVDAVFISCGALRSLHVIDALEHTLGKPVICSNQAMTWDCLRLAGITDQFGGFGRLFVDY